MPNVKTTISLEAPLFHKAAALAREMKISRGRLFALALEDFVQRYQNERLLEQINAAYKARSNPDEQALLQAWQPQLRRLAEGDW